MSTEKEEKRHPGLIKVSKLGISADPKFKLKNVYSKYGAKKWDEAQQPKITFNKLEDKDGDALVELEKEIMKAIKDKNMIPEFEGKEIETHDSIGLEWGYTFKTSMSRFCTYWKRDKKGEKVEVPERDFLKMSKQMDCDYNVSGSADIVWYNVKDMKMGVKYIIDAIVFNGPSKKFKKICPV